MASGCLLMVVALLALPGQGDGVAQSSQPAGIAEPEASEEKPAIRSGSLGPQWPENVLLPESYPERLFDFLQLARQDSPVPITGGAWHWFHINQNGPNASGYGIPPNQSGTYFWYLLADPETPVDAGPVSRIGYHVQLRLREEDTFRVFFPTQVWTWENYAWLDTEVGRFKAGQIWKRFGLDWDGSFWGSVLFYDGFKLNADHGVSWENTWKAGDGFQVDSFAQFFLVQDGYNGTIRGSDPESLPGSSRHNTGVVRLIPTWVLPDQSTFALGLSALVGEIRNQPVIPIGSQKIAAWGIDATYARGPLRLYAEVLRSHGVFNPARYVSGGSSRRITDALAGIRYQLGPATFYFNFSLGIDERPSGWQTLYVGGVVLALTKNVDLYAEYAHWDVFRARDHAHLVFEDGYQCVINWRF